VLWQRARENGRLLGRRVESGCIRPVLQLCHQALKTIVIKSYIILPPLTTQGEGDPVAKITNKEKITKKVTTEDTKGGPRRTDIRWVVQITTLFNTEIVPEPKVPA